MLLVYVCGTDGSSLVQHTVFVSKLHDHVTNDWKQFEDPADTKTYLLGGQ